jgi:hypothetical protein
MWWATAMFVVLIYAQFFAKYAIHPPETGPQYVNVRLLNRTLLAVTMCLLGMALQYWARSEQEAGAAQPRSSLPPDQSNRFQRHSRNFDAMMAIVIFPVLVIVIAATDRFSPSNFNLPVLYTLPLFLCAWARNRLILWCLLIAVLALTVWGYMYGPPPVGASSNPTIPFKNRILASCVLIVVTAMLHWWITSDARRTINGDVAR